MSVKYPFTYSGFQYAKRCVDGQEVISQITLATCKRFFKDLDRIKNDPECPFYFDYEKSERYLTLVQKFKHVKGRDWKSELITYEPWQNFFFACIMGFMSKKTGRRRFRSVFLEVARGNAKSTMSSQAGLYFLALDGEVGPDIFCASTKKDAARIVFDASRDMALRNESFLKSTKTEVQMHKLLHSPSSGVMKPVASDSKNMDGWNPSLIIGDEIHEWNRKLYDVLDSSLTKRNDSMFLMITTAGLSTEGIGYETHCYSEKVIRGEVEDDTWFGLIYTLDKGDDWQNPKVWSKANPNWGVSVDAVNLEAKAKKAAETPASQLSFKVKHLNLWQNQTAPFFNLDKWDLCTDKSLKIENFRGEKCFLGIDLAAKVDLCALVYIFRKNGKYYKFFKAYLPQAKIDDNRNVMYRRWVDEGYLNVHPGEVINFEKIQDEIIADSKIYKIVTAFYDPWSANETGQRLIKERVEAAEFRMTTQNFSEPMKKMDALIREGKMVHDGNPVARWCYGNVEVKYDANDNVFPRKNHERLKIDIAVASFMPMAGWISDQGKEQVYESRGLRHIG